MMEKQDKALEADQAVMAVMGENYTEVEEDMEQMGETIQVHPMRAEAEAAYLDQAEMEDMVAAVEEGYSDVAEGETLLDQE